MTLVFAFPCLVLPALPLVDDTPATFMLLLTYHIGVCHLVVALALCGALVVSSAGLLDTLVPFELKLMLQSSPLCQGLAR